MKLLDGLLNRVTMYRLVVYGLCFIIVIAFVEASVGRLAFMPLHMLISLSILLVSSLSTDYIFGKIWNVPRNSESWLITALILFLVLEPASSLAGDGLLLLAGVVANSSKYIIAWQGKHIFNPAALAIAMLSLTSLLPSSWWVGSAALWPFTLATGLLIVIKIKRLPMVLTFVAVSLAVQFATLIIGHHPVVVGLHNAVVASPLIFLSTIMLTEPATMPPRKHEQLLFATIVGALYATAFHAGPLYIYPEVALLIGNIYAHMVSPKYRIRLELQEIQKISNRIYNYVFLPDRQFNFLPGQYMEWTLANVPFDNRGNRRTFTIASSPTENEVHVGLKYYNPPSMYKQVFSRLKPGDIVYASQLAGDFTLNEHEDKKLAFIAGGIGITPFRSMAKYITDNQIHCDIILLYIVSDISELAYLAEFEAAKTYGLKCIPITTQKEKPTGNVMQAKLTKQLLASSIPDYAERIFYISGPNTMVDVTKKHLIDLHVKRSDIKTDHFTGY
jgi:ferredoxin-NADP reductase